jgi:hypothetical protein
MKKDKPNQTNMILQKYNQEQKRVFQKFVCLRNDYLLENRFLLS